MSTVLNLAVYDEALEDARESRLILAIPYFDPGAHPRDPNGKFAAKIGGLARGDKIRPLGDAAVVVENHREGDGFKVHVGTGKKKQSKVVKDQSAAAKLALKVAKQLEDEGEQEQPDDFSKKFEKVARSMGHGVPARPKKYRYDKVKLSAATEDGELLLSFDGITFDPLKHPRDLKGQFRKALNGLKPGEKLKTPDGIVVTRMPGAAGFAVKSHDNEIGTKFEGQAVDFVLNESAVDDHRPGALGGQKEFYDVDEAIRENERLGDAAAAAPPSATPSEKAKKLIDAYDEQIEKLNGEIALERDPVMAASKGKIRDAIQQQKGEQQRLLNESATKPASSVADALKAKHTGGGRPDGRNLRERARPRSTVQSTPAAAPTPIPAPPTPTVTRPSGGVAANVSNSPGRGPSGKLRNLRSMGDEKFEREAQGILDYHDSTRVPFDREVVQAVFDEALSRGSYGDLEDQAFGMLQQGAGRRGGGSPAPPAAPTRPPVQRFVPSRARPSHSEIGRSDTGRPRNFKAMKDGKFQDLFSVAKVYADAEIWQLIEAEAKKRGIT